MNDNFLSAWLGAKHIPRWSLKMNLVNFNDATHSFECSIIGHMIATIDRDIFHSQINPERIAVLCIYHEADEVGGVSDLNSDVKYLVPECTKAIKLLGNIIEQKLIDKLPEELQLSFTNLIVQEKNTRDAYICKAADDISAYLESKKECALGNTDFIKSNQACQLKVLQWVEKFECVRYFIKHFVPEIDIPVHSLDKDNSKESKK